MLLLALLGAASCGAGVTGSLQPTRDGGPSQDLGSADSQGGDAPLDGFSKGEHDATDGSADTPLDGVEDVSNDAGADGILDAAAAEASGGEDAGPDLGTGDAAEDAGDGGDAGDDASDAGDAAEDARDEGDTPADARDAAEEVGDAAEDASDAGKQAGDAAGETGGDRGGVVRIPDGTWADWESLGGDILGRPAVVASGGNQLDVAVRQTDNAIHHQRFLTHWTGFSTIGGVMKGDPDLGLNVNGEVDLVARGISDRIYYKVRNPYTGQWAPSLWNWFDMGGVGADGPHIAERATGERDVVVIGSDLVASRKERDPETGDWLPSLEGDWSPLGGPSAVTPTILDVGGRTYLTTRSSTGNGMMKHRTTTWAPSETTWEDIGGPIASAPAMASWQTGRLDVIARLPDGAVGFKTWTGSWQPSQTGWVSLGGNVIGRPSIVAWGEGRLDIVARGANGKLVYKHWSNELGWWPSIDEWATLGDFTGGDPVIVSWGPRRLDVFVRGDDGALWHRARID